MHDTLYSFSTMDSACTLYTDTKMIESEILTLIVIIIIYDLSIQ